MSGPDMQAEVSNAFAWVHRVYDETNALLREAITQFEGLGFDVWYEKPEPLMGQATVYFLAHCFSTPDELNAERATDVFLGVSFYADGRHPRGAGPTLIAGTVRRARNVDSLVKALNLAARAPGEAERFRVVSASGDMLVRCEPTPAGRDQFPAVEEVRSFALPLTAIRTPEQLREVAGAAVRLRDGDHAPARDLVARWSP